MDRVEIDIGEVKVDRAILHQSCDAGGEFVATVRKTITLTDAQDDWIKAQVANGDFTNDSEYFRDLIRRDQEKERTLKAAIAEFTIGRFGSEQARRNRDDLKSCLSNLAENPQVGRRAEQLAKGAASL